MSFLLLLFVASVQATVFVTTPSLTSSCHGGQSCAVAWLDNGVAPLLSNIGPCLVGLYNGRGLLVQQIEPVNVASVQSLTFTPDPAAGPDSTTYYINFTSVNPLGNPPAHYTQYSTFFVLTGMSGSFASPVPSDTSTRPVPSTVASPPSTNITSTVVINNSVSSSGSAVVPSTSGASAAQTSSESSSSAAPPDPTNSAASSSASRMTSSWHGTLVPLLAWIAASAPFLL